MQHKAKRCRDLSLFLPFSFKQKLVVKHQGQQCHMVYTSRLGGLADTKDFGGGNEISGLKIAGDFGVW